MMPYYLHYMTIVIIIISILMLAMRQAPACLVARK
jgi:competence protein ComGC